MRANKIFMFILGIVIVMGFFAVLGLLIFNPVPETNSQVLYLLLGQLAAAFLMVVAYFYGSSKGSADKTEFMAKANGEPISSSTKLGNGEVKP